MLDSSDLIDAIVAALKTNNDLVQLLANADPASISAYYHDDNAGTNFEQRVQEQEAGTILVAWRGTRTGNFARNEATKHDFASLLSPSGKAGQFFAAFMNGVCQNYTAPMTTDSQNAKFRLTTIHGKCFPPDSVSMIPQPIFIAPQYGIYDTLPITFTLTEKGLDV